MINGYMSVGLIHEARCIFNDMSIKNLISWSTMIGGYATNDHPHIALELFRLFKEQGLRADVSIITGVCIACSKLGILGVAKSAIQDYVGPSLYSHLPFVAALIQMYGGCGRIEMACKVFEEVSHRDRDLSCYNSMISAFASHGMGKEALYLFDDMQKQNVKPDSESFLGLLRACVHDGLVEEAKELFTQMTEEYKIQPTEEHYACLVEIFARREDFHEASMIGRPSSAVWRALIGAFNVKFKVAVTNLLKIEPERSKSFILLFNKYVSTAQSRDLSNITEMFNFWHVKRVRGSSVIELGSNVHSFIDYGKWNAGDIQHILKNLDEEMRPSLERAVLPENCCN